MSDQHRAPLSQKASHGRHARVHRLNLQPDLAGGILHETSQRHAVGDIGRRIVQVGRPSLGKEALGNGHQGVAQPGGRPGGGRRAGLLRDARALAVALHVLSPCAPDGARSTICP